MSTVTLTDLSADEAQFRDLCREFAAAEVAPHAAAWWEEERSPVELFLKMGELDMMGLLVPEEFGGANVSTVAMVAGLYEFGRVDQSVAACWQAHLTIGSLPLLAFGDREQKEKFLVPLATGQKLGSFGLTEPDAGSDAAGICTRAERDGDEWVVNGSKVFISNACTPISQGPVILAQLPAENGKPSYGNFVVPLGTPGFEYGPKLRGIGWRSLDSRGLTFADVRLPADHLIGAAGRGLAQFLQILEVGRITIATLGISLTQAVLDLALDYAKHRQQFGRPISKFQAIQFKLADIAAQLEAVRLLVYDAARRRDAGRPFRMQAAMAKLLASRLAMHAASEAVQIHGGYGFMHESPVSRFFCDAKVLEIGEGTNEVQHIVIARELGC